MGYGRDVQDTFHAKKLCLVPGKCQQRSYTASVPKDFCPGDCPAATQHSRTLSLRDGASGPDPPPLLPTQPGCETIPTPCGSRV